MDLGLFDRYFREARLAPALILVVPVLATFIVLVPEAREVLPGIVITLGGLAATVVVAQAVRRPGKQLEPRLFGRWGGAPTTRLLRVRSEAHSGTDRRREDVMRATGVQLPGPADEEQDPRAADAEYEHAVGILRELTRGHPTVLGENATYGFRRNSYALRFLGRWSSISLLIAVVALQWSGMVVLDPATLAVLAMVLMCAFVFWMWVVRERWVQEAAERYATALFQAAKGIRR